jgi:hypothetical protein
LRKWYGHDVGKWPQFQERYRGEIANHGELFDLIRDIERHRKVVTLLFGAKDEQHKPSQRARRRAQEQADAPWSLTERTPWTHHASSGVSDGSKTGAGTGECRAEPALPADAQKGRR